MLVKVAQDLVTMVAGAILNQGVSSGREDEFLNVLRVEGIHDAAERDAFYADNKYEVYRITPSEDFRVAHSDKFESFNGKMRTRWTGISESVQGAVSNAQLASGLKELKAAVIQTHRHLLDYVSVPFKVRPSPVACACFVSFVFGFRAL